MPEGGKGGGEGSPGSLSDDEEDSDTEPDTGHDEDSPNPGVGAGDDPEGGNPEADVSEAWSGCEGDDPDGYDSGSEKADDESTDADANTYADGWHLLGFLCAGEGEGEDDDDDYEYGPATNEQVLSLPCVSRRISNGDLTQDAAVALWSKQAENSCGEKEFADSGTRRKSCPTTALTTPIPSATRTTATAP